jgi:hypothetical protein
MRKIVVAAILLSLLGTSSASAHQPVVINKSETTPDRGPLLVDGTISFAVRVAFTKAGESRGFRFQLKDGDLLSLQYLIVDKVPENKLKASQLPSVTIVSPTGSRTSMKFNERTKFYEPYGGVNYLYLSRISATGVNGIYKVVITSRAKSTITLGVGNREVPGEVLRGPVKTPTAAPTASSSPSPSTAPTVAPSVAPSAAPTQAGITLAQVAQNKSADSCWSAIDGNVYDLTRWINSHPGGAAAIRSLCGVDGSVAFAAQHYGQVRPVSRLAMYLLGPLSR